MADRITSFSSILFSFASSKFVFPHSDPRGSFRSTFAYSLALLQTPVRFYRNSFRISGEDSETQKVEKRAQALKRTLEWYDILFFGLAAIVGGGIFSSLGQIISKTAGSATIISFVIAGISALLSISCFAELAAASPCGGGAFNFVIQNIGEFPAFLVGSSVLLQYSLFGSGLARSFSSSLSFTLGFSSDNAWRFGIEEFPDTFGHWDLLAAGLVIGLMVIACCNMKATSPVNMGIVALYSLLVVAMVLGGIIHGRTSNFLASSAPSIRSGFAPFGINGVITGAALAYFSFIGYDAVASLSEECRDTNSAMPFGLLTSVGISTLAFSGLTTVLASLLPYDLVPLQHPFARSFYMDEVFVFVSDVAVTIGSFVAVLMLIVAASRHLGAMARSSLLPRSISSVNGSTGTPINATLVAGTIMAVIAYAADLSSLNGMIVLAAFVSFTAVAVSLILRRYKSSDPEFAPAPFYIALFIVTSVGFTACYQKRAPLWLTIVAGVLCLLETGLFSRVGDEKKVSEHWHIPAMPWIPSLCIFVNIFLAGSLDSQSFSYFGIFIGGVSVFYLLFSLHNSYDELEWEKSTIQT